MYMRESERAKREAAITAELAAAAKVAWDLCADASRALLQLGDDPQFRELAHGHEGLFAALPASLAPSMHMHRADAILGLAVARATLQPMLARVEVLGWLARAHPDALVTLLKIIAPASGAHGFATKAMGH
ncbi:hypothetical protein ACVWWJ_002682 [Luteibacter sp. HA06]